MFKNIHKRGEIRRRLATEKENNKNKKTTNQMRFRQGAPFRSINLVNEVNTWHRGCHFNAQMSDIFIDPSLYNNKQQNCRILGPI